MSSSVSLLADDAVRISLAVLALIGGHVLAVAIAVFSAIPLNKVTHPGFYQEQIPKRLEQVSLDGVSLRETKTQRRDCNVQPIVSRTRATRLKSQSWTAEWISPWEIGQDQEEFFPNAGV